MEPLYTSDRFEVSAEDLEAIPWVARTPARLECFMSPMPRTYTYGSGLGVRTYESVPMEPWVAKIMEALPGNPNVCFFNRYDSRANALGWHSDDSPDTSDDDPISVVSFGEEREIWWKPIGATGVVPLDCRKKLGSGSLFVMPPGFQILYRHKIPKGDREMGVRVSLTFRKMLDPLPSLA